MRARQLLLAASIFLLPAVGLADDTVREASSLADGFRQDVLPVLESHCFDCHGYGSAEGGMELDIDPSDKDVLADREKWWSVLKNLRSGVMPPAGMPAPDDQQKRQIARWVTQDVFGIDPANIDPGPATVRRLNRFEYGNTIRDLMGIDFDEELLFPPDDSGFGFDNVGEAQTLSPMLVEKYLHAAKQIVDRAVPTETRVIAFQEFHGGDFREAEGGRDARRMSVDDPLTVSRTFDIAEAGSYRVILDAMVNGSFFFHPRRCTVEISIDGEQRSSDEYGWQERFQVDKTFEEQFEPGQHSLTLELTPLPYDEENEDKLEELLDEDTHAHYYLHSVRVQGPVDPPQWQHPKNYGRFFPRDQPPQSEEKRRGYAQQVLQQFTRRAFRRPCDPETLERLVQLAESVYQRPDKTFEAGIAQAITAVLASPRFLLLMDFPAEGAPEGEHPYVDEYALASRLSYFFWSTMPDEELMGLADRGELRDNLDSQVARLLADRRSDDMIREFVGQWLRSRDVDHVSIDSLAALGFREEYDKLVKEFRRRFRRGRRRSKDEERSPEEQAELDEMRQRFRELRKVGETFDDGLRRAMRRETEMMFEHIVRENRSVLELIDSDYTFLNEELAEHYGIEGVDGGRMRRVELPDDNPRGGVLTQGTMLTVTSNPTRTSPVKRGLYVLENLLGTPPPPPPAGIPELEESADHFGDREPTLREVLEVHRESELCASCHSRMDPLGLALENFNALGIWRDQEHGNPIDASGELVSGEVFDDVRQLKQILKTEHRRSFYRCLTEKMLTYALGRGLDFYDVLTVDQVVDQLDENDGRMDVVLNGVIRSAPFQRMRGGPAAKVANQVDDRGRDTK